MKNEYIKIKYRGENGIYEEWGLCYKDERIFGYFFYEWVLLMGWLSLYILMFELKIILSKLRLLKFNVLNIFF